MKKMIVSLTVMVFVFSQNLRAQQPTAVDLGLSVKWANCNLGASRPEGAGNYYTWGDTKKWDSSRTGDSKWYKTRWREGVGGEGFIKYCRDYSKWTGTGKPDGKSTLDPQDDAVRVNLGGKWRMPTYAEIMELYNNCTWEWRIQNGTKGYKVTSSKNGRSIFLPIVGYWWGHDYKNTSYSGYLSSSLWKWDNHCWGIILERDNVEIGSLYRGDGFCIRPVCK